MMDTQYTILPLLLLYHVNRSLANQKGACSAGVVLGCVSLQRFCQGPPPALMHLLGRSVGAVWGPVRAGGHKDCRTTASSYPAIFRAKKSRTCRRVCRPLLWQTHHQSIY